MISGCKRERQIRNPKSEIRKKSEARNPKLRAVRNCIATLCSQISLSTGLTHNSHNRHSSFGFRISFGFRMSVFGFLLLCGCLRHEPRADLTILNGTEPESLDPHVITGQADGRIALSLFE